MSAETPRAVSGAGRPLGDRRVLVTGASGGIGAAVARRPSEATGIYAASKTAVAAAAESLRLELGPRGIRVCLLEPGRVDTDIGHNARLEPGGRHGTLGSNFTPLTAEEVADVVAFALTRPANLALNTVVLRPVGQEFP